MLLQHKVANSSVGQMIERDLQQSLKTEFKLWRQETERGQRTYTSWDNSVSQALRTLLESFEATKRKSDGFSEDGRFIFLHYVSIFLCIHLGLVLLTNLLFIISF